MIVKENLLLGYVGTRIAKARNTGTAQDNYNFQWIFIPTNLKENQKYTLCFKAKQLNGSGELSVIIYDKKQTNKAAKVILQVDDERMYFNFVYRADITGLICIYSDVAGQTRGVGLELKDIILVEGHFERGGNEIVYLPHKDDLPEDKQALLPPEGNYKEITSL